ILSNKQPEMSEVNQAGSADAPTTGDGAEVSGEASQQQPQQQSSDKWLVALKDPTPGLNTLSQCMVLTDVTGDGENRLVVADLGDTRTNMRLRVYKGTALAMENTIIDLPVGVAAFYLDTNTPRSPAVAVASGPSVFIYKNMRPYFRFTLPPLDLHPLEEEIWAAAREGRASAVQVRGIIEDLRNQGASITGRSQRLLALHPDQLQEFVEAYKTAPLRRLSVVTALDTLKKSHSEEDAISCLVMGTEACQVQVLDPQAFTVLAKMQLPSPPVFLCSSGLFDVDYRIVAACRDGVIYQLRRGAKEATQGIRLRASAVGMIRVDKHIVVATMDRQLSGYSTKGKELWRAALPAGVTALAPLSLPSKGFNAALVAMDNNTVCVYKDKLEVDRLVTEDVVTGIRFGRYGREEATLVTVGRSGGLAIYILKRSAKFVDGAGGVGGPPAKQFSRLPLPKKTRLFVDQTLRERDCAVSMHRQFLHDLYRLRLMTAENYVQALETKATPISASKEDPVKLACTVQGVGPVFRLTVGLQNASLTTAIAGLGISFAYDGLLYRLEKVYIPVPYLVPGLTYNFSTIVECLTDKGIADAIKVYILKRDNDSPLVTGVVNMPVSESFVV
ncbi:hypothetical protein BOX15_Mlig015041g1, partial [Macrostomum lignano]